jgi:hypothetical protein
VNYIPSSVDLQHFPIKTQVFRNFSIHSTNLQLAPLGNLQLAWHQEARGTGLVRLKKYALPKMVSKEYLKRSHD